MRRMQTLIALVLLTGCAAQTTWTEDEQIAKAAADNLDVGAGGAADSADLLIDTALGTVHEGHVERHPLNAAVTTESLRGRMDVFRFHVEAGQSFALVLEGTDGELEPQLMLRDGDNFEVANAKQQGLLPMLRETDAVAVHTAPVTGPYFAFVLGEELHSAGDYRFRLIALPEDPKALLGITDPAVRAYTAELRQHEERLRSFAARGQIVELEDGFVETTGRDSFDGTLREWAELRQTVSVVNQLRVYLFAAHLQASDLPDDDPELLATVGRSCALIWAEVSGNR